MHRHLLFAGLIWAFSVLHPAGALASDMVPEWLVGSWRLMDVYIFHNTKDEREEYRRMFWPDIGKDTIKYLSDSVDYSESGLTPGGGVDVVVRDLGSAYGKWLPSAVATSAFSGRRLAISKITTAVSVETSHCYNQSDRSDLGTSDGCVGTLVAKLEGSNRIDGLNRVAVFAVTGFAKHPIIDCLFIYENP